MGSQGEEGTVRDAVDDAGAAMMDRVALLHMRGSFQRAPGSASSRTSVYVLVHFWALYSPVEDLDIRRLLVDNPRSPMWPLPLLTSGM